MEVNIRNINVDLAQAIQIFFNSKAFSAWARKCNDENEILDYCIKKAWLDAVVYERTRVNSAIMYNRDKIKQKLKIELTDNLTHIASNFDDWHKAMCADTFCGMRCGVWQKLINMTFKYIYCARIEKEMLKQFDSVFLYCNCPLDSAIANYILNKINRNDVNYELIKSIAYSRKTNWNNINYEQYSSVQGVIENLASIENLTALQFDVVHWKNKKKCLA